MTGPVGSLPAASVSVARATLNVAIFLAALVAVCTSLGAVLPFPEVKGIHQKWTHFQEHKGRYDAVFLGSSRVYRQIIPPQFDERVKSVSGRDIRSFNFGMDALWPPESCFLLREILEAKPPRLRWVFIEVMNIMTRIENTNEVSRRLAYWHDGPHTWMALRETTKSNLPSMEKWRLLGAHSSLFLRRSTNQGFAAEWWSAKAGTEKSKDSSRSEEIDEMLDMGGFRPGEGKSLGGKDRTEFEISVEKARSGLRPVRLSDVFRDALNRMIVEVRAAGAEPILFLSPSSDARENFVELPEGVVILDFRNPDRYPELFEAKYRYDAAHLNRAGAEIYTKLLAEQFAGHLRNHQ